MSDTALRTLADRLGILREYVDQTGRETRVTSDETRIAILAAMGFDAHTEADAARALELLDARERSRALRPVRVLVHGSTFTLPSSRATLTLEQGGQWRPGAELPLGYHTLAMGDDTQTLIVVPPRAATIDRRATGIIANLYAVRSDANWGVGDISDLSTIAEWSGSKGAAFVGVNPLHALRNRGNDISPYSPISRLYRNPVYIDVGAVPELSESADARALLGDPATQRTLDELRASTQVDYDGVWSLKRRLLEMLHRTFVIRHRDARTPRGREYRAYIDEEGATLQNFATFCALEDHFGAARQYQRLAASGPSSSVTPLPHTSLPSAQRTRPPSTFTRGSSSSSIDSSASPPRVHGLRDSTSGSIRISRSAPHPTAPTSGRSDISSCVVSPWARPPMATRRRDRTGDSPPSIPDSSPRIATHSGSRSSAHRCAMPAPSASITSSASSGSSGFPQG